MRKIRCVLLAWVGLTAMSCATDKVPPPKEFLDGRTGASVTVTRDPLQFGVERDLREPNKNGYVSLTAASVDHSGEFQLYLVSYIWWLDPRAGEPGVVKLIADGHDIILKPLAQFPDDLRDRHKLHAPGGGDFHEFAYLVSIDLLQSIADSHDLALRLPAPIAADSAEEERYEFWTDSRGALKSFIEEVRPQFGTAANP